MRGLLTALLVAVLIPGLARGQAAEGSPTPQVFTADKPAPKKAADLVWRHKLPTGATIDTLGVWLTDRQEQVVGKKILTCSAALNQSLDSNAHCEVALATVRGESKVPTWVWIAIGVVGGGLVGYGAGWAAGRVSK